jgi:hypothetical protein
MEIVQKEIPTISFALRTSPPAANVVSGDSKLSRTNAAVLEVSDGDFSVMGGDKLI